MMLPSGRRPRRAALGRAGHDDQPKERARSLGHRHCARMRRRDLLLLTTGMIGARAVRAQQKAMPVIGYLQSASPGPSAPYLGGLQQGLSEAGYLEGQNLTIE